MIHGPLACISMSFWLCFAIEKVIEFHLTYPLIVLYNSNWYKLKQKIETKIFNLKYTYIIFSKLKMWSFSSSSSSFGSFALDLFYIYYWKCYFSICPLVSWLVWWSVGWSVCLLLFPTRVGSYTSILLSEHLLFYFTKYYYIYVLCCACTVHLLMYL